ncbi:MAG: hypothetical protein GY716_02960 [bacterium]|nr:hypothetical protein [bacterium]
MGMSVGGGNEYQSEINVTPLVDVVLVLLIIFMVIVPMTLHGHDLDVPAESPAPAVVDEPPREQVVLRIDLGGCPVVVPHTSPGLPEDCRVLLNDEELPASMLTARVAELFAGYALDDRVLFLQAHDSLNYEAVMRIVDAAKAGVEGLRIGMVAPPQKAPRGADAV